MLRLAILTTAARALQRPPTCQARATRRAVSLVSEPAAHKKVRPSRDDVDRISWGKPSKKKGVGSRGTPHRLNADERDAYDRAKRAGFVETAGSAWRAERRDAPLLNTWRNWCDATAAPFAPARADISSVAAADGDALNWYIRRTVLP